jgi:hypothetical protein
MVPVAADNDINDDGRGEDGDAMEFKLVRINSVVAVADDDDEDDDSIIIVQLSARRPNK